MNITSKLNQTCVHWSTKTADGYGGHNFATVTERSCRWSDKQEIFTNAQGRDELSKAVVYIDADAAPGEYLYLGEEDDLDSSHTDPEIISGCYEIKAFAKIPSVSAGTYLRKIWL